MCGITSDCSTSCIFWTQDSRLVWCRFGSLATLDEDEEEDDAGSVASQALTDDDFSGPSIEEIDAAVREVSQARLTHEHNHALCTGIMPFPRHPLPYLML